MSFIYMESNGNLIKSINARMKMNVNDYEAIFSL